MQTHLKNTVALSGASPVPRRGGKRQEPWQQLSAMPTRATVTEIRVEPFAPEPCKPRAGLFMAMPFQKSCSDGQRYQQKVVPKNPGTRSEEGEHLRV